MIFFLVNPKVWIALAVLCALALLRRQWRSWRARRRLAATARRRAVATGPAGDGQRRDGPPQVRRPA